jgi:hypothetical protein
MQMMVVGVMEVGAVMVVGRATEEVEAAVMEAPQGLEVKLVPLPVIVVALDSAGRAATAAVEVRLATQEAQQLMWGRHPAVPSTMVVLDLVELVEMVAVVAHQEMVGAMVLWRVL